MRSYYLTEFQYPSCYHDLWHMYKDLQVGEVCCNCSYMFEAKVLQEHEEQVSLTFPTTGTSLNSPVKSEAFFFIYAYVKRLSVEILAMTSDVISKVNLV